MSDLSEFAQEQLLDFIRAGICPVCERGPFKVLAAHTTRAHELTGDDLRDAAGLLRHASICDPAFSARNAEIMRERIKNGFVPPVTQPGVTRTYGPAGKRIAQRAADEARELITPEIRREAVLRGGRARGAQLRTERKPCIVCGAQIPRARLAAAVVCSEACLRAHKSALRRAANLARPAAHDPSSGRFLPR